MKKIKTFIKNLIWKLISNKEGFNDLTVLGGPAKGTKLRLDIRKEGSYWLGNYDKWIFDRVPLDKILKPGWVVWDCGAYVGYYTAVFRRIIGDKGKVITFEAARKNYNIVKVIPELNKWKNVSILNMAVGPDHSTIKFVNNLGGSSGPYGLTKTYGAQENQLELEEVQCCGVDELVYEKNIDAPDFIKFDLETAEEFALHNGPRLFTTKRPIVLLELHGQKALEAAGKFLEQYNYSSMLVWDMPNAQKEYHTLDELLALGFIPHMIYCQPKKQ
ncbi:MAG TPA: FkbM family methyltransferase [Chitinophagaceae bacterium]|nr:FkbM family methyltransferase [Chitinophagaceae bacterium]